VSLRIRASCAAATFFIRLFSVVAPSSASIRARSALWCIFYFRLVLAAALYSAFFLGVSGFSTVFEAVENAIFRQYTFPIHVVGKLAFSTASETVENPKTPETKNIAA
jgi:hypothetical protein